MFTFQEAEGEADKPADGGDGQPHDGLTGALGLRLARELHVQQPPGPDDALVARARWPPRAAPARHAPGLAAAPRPGRRQRQRVRVRPEPRLQVGLARVTAASGVAYGLGRSLPTAHAAAAVQPGRLLPLVSLCGSTKKTETIL